MQAAVAELVVRAALIVADYYKLQPGTPVKEVLRAWKEEGQKAYDQSMPQWYKARDLWPWREYTWSREDSRGGFGRVNGKQVWLDGPAKWDALTESMKMNGWDKDNPLHLTVGRNGKAKVSEGNHRLAIAVKLGIKVPVWFHFYQKVEKNPQHPERREVDVITPKALKRSFKKHGEDYKLSPEEIERNERQVDEILKLLADL